MIDQVDVTDRAVAASWDLPEGFRVRAWTVPDEEISDPRDAGDVYATDVDETDYGTPTHAFCTHCDAWLHRLDRAGAEQVVRAYPHREGEDAAVAGDWMSQETGISCLEGITHEPNEPLAVRWWRADRWSFVIVIVAVTDQAGREWGYASLGSVEAGTFPQRIDKRTGRHESVELDPLDDPEYPLPDLITEALHEARAALATHATAAPTITAPHDQTGSTAH